MNWLESIGLEDYWPHLIDNGFDRLRILRLCKGMSAIELGEELELRKGAMKKGHIMLFHSELNKL